MIKSRVIWALCLVGTFALFFFADSPLALLPLVLAAAVPLVLILLNQLAGRRVRASLALPQIGEKGGQLVCCLSAGNGGRLPLSPVRCRLRCENLLTGEVSRPEVLFPIGARGERAVPFVLESDYCGCIEASVEALEVYDAFGLFAARPPCEARAEATVLPDTFAPHLTVLTHLSKDIEADEYSQEKPGADPSETFAIRAYRPGDSLRRIHWKLSGKFDELLIKEPGLPVRHSFLLLLETSRPGGAPIESDVGDALAEIALSLCQAMTEEEITYEVGWQDHGEGRFFRARVGSLEELTGVVDKMLKARPRADGGDAFRYYTEAFGESTFEHLLYVSPFLPAGFETFAGEARATGIICTRDTAAAGAGADTGLYFCSPDNYERELYDLAI